MGVKTERWTNRIAKVERRTRMNDRADVLANFGITFEINGGTNIAVHSGTSLWKNIFP